MTRKVLLIGCGNMGFAMLRGWRAAEDAPEVHCVEPTGPLRDRAAEIGAHPVPALGALPEGLAPDLVVLAVKPQMVTGVLGDCARFAERGATFVSIAAGMPIARMAAALPEGTPIIRCMPNTPASIGEGMLAFCAGPGVSDEAKAFTQALFETSGAVAWIEDEALMDAVTAISGSGPAYVFLFVEALAAAGEALGLPAETALLLAKQTVAGAGRMVATSDTAPDVLRQQVTSPKGTTAAALEILMGKPGLAGLLAQATVAARDRGVELGKEE
jgi:pyrroline-5-carboxylate reductase